MTTTPSPVEALKACPLCKGPAYRTEAVDGSAMLYIGCAKCGLSMKAAWVCLGPPDKYGWSRDLDAAWNTRPDALADTGGGEAWLPIVICPTDGVDRLLKLTDGREVIGNFDSRQLGRNRWQTRSIAYHNPARIVGQRGGVDQWSAAYDTFLISELPEGVYPTHFRPNDTIHGKPTPTPPEAEDDGPIADLAPAPTPQPTQQPTREEVAKAISPDWFTPVDEERDRTILCNHPGQYRGYQKRAYEAADRVLALFPASSVPEGMVAVKLADLEALANPDGYRIISGSPGPLYSAGFAGAGKAVCERVRAMISASQIGEE